MTLSKTGIETIENQGETSFCWLFAAAKSIVKSMWMRLGLLLITRTSNRKYLVIVPNSEMSKTHLLVFCNKPGFHVLDYQPVITLIRISSRSGEIDGHAVVLHSYDRDDDILVLTTIDSASPTGYTYVKCSIVTENGRPDLVIGEFVDRLCLGSKQCYVMYLG